MKGRLTVSWAASMLIAAGFLIPAVASASSREAPTGRTVAAAASPSLLWPCYDPKTYPPSSPPLTPPTAPGTPQPVSVVNIYVHLRWTAATDPDGLACYQVFEERSNGTKIKVATFGPDALEGRFTVDWPSGTTPSRVATLYIVAVDRWGAESPPSGKINVTIYNDIVPPPSPSPTPSPTPTPSNCRVAYSSQGWYGGMTASVSITNTGTTTIAGWQLNFNYPDAGQRVGSGWGAVWSQTGTAVTATALSWNRNISPGGTVTIGYNGTNQGANPAPSNFQLNGIPCR
ncbi:cellulose binding domain-containing protein [Sphaerisporangium aureirubrum]|uniref:Cellulose binding domain-containing protein n=1 Tax=Sphaerisporangium aureirubrum TaxID=1544736 RepID=A0ABW1ND54_9ACTN